jgi:hypothetical protein
LRAQVVAPLLLLLFAAVLVSACSEAVYPARPPATPGPPIADPPHSRLVVHLTVTQKGLGDLLEKSVPKTGDGTFALLGTRRYAWQRGPLELRLDGARGRIGVVAPIEGEVSLPAAKLRFTMALTAEVQPVISSEYLAVLQDPQVELTTQDRVLRAAEWGAGALGKIKEAVVAELRKLRVDLRPLLLPAIEKVARPLSVKVGDAEACVHLGLRGVEAGPTVLAGGLEKDVAVVIAPSVTLPCAPPPQPFSGLPPLANVSQLPTGPFEVTVPVAASYAELQKAMTQAFTDGKLYFSKDLPHLYIEKPEIYAGAGQLVVKVSLNGHVQRGLKIPISGELFLSGHARVEDNELAVPDLEPTVETRNALLKLGTSLSTDTMRQKIRQALRLDLSARLAAVKERFSRDLSFAELAAGSELPPGCLRAEVGRIEVSGIHAHDSYLRLYVKVTARASVYLPCPSTAQAGR